MEGQAIYNKTREKILSQFSKEFSEHQYIYNPLFHQIVETLIREDKPYQIIEQLLLDRNRLIEEINKLKGL